VLVIRPFMLTLSGYYVRGQVNKSQSQPIMKRKASFMEMNNGEIIESQNSIKFENVPIYTPNGDLLIAQINLELAPGMHCIVTGPNGCGKSSLFRILGSLWPIFSGKLFRPKLQNMFYIPQVIDG
jgi:ATP-binding cassette subfamily D (ALD) protein 3